MTSVTLDQDVVMRMKRIGEPLSTTCNKLLLEYLKKREPELMSSDELEIAILKQEAKDEYERRLREIKEAQRAKRQ